jgi:rRNA-processing protein FCF1
MATVAMDTSALMMPVERGVRVFEELERLLGDSEARSASDSSSAERSSADSRAAEPRDDGGTPRGIECAVPEAVRDELAKLSDGAGEEAVAASVGADLAAERCRTVEHDASYADDALVELAPEFDYVVTNDGPLKERVLDAGTPVIHIRGRNKLAIRQP